MKSTFDDLKRVNIDDKNGSLSKSQLSHRFLWGIGRPPRRTVGGVRKGPSSPPQIRPGVPHPVGSAGLRLTQPETAVVGLDALGNSFQALCNYLMLWLSLPSLSGPKCSTCLPLAPSRGPRHWHEKVRLRPTRSYRSLGAVLKITSRNRAAGSLARHSRVLPPSSPEIARSPR